LIARQAQNKITDVARSTAESITDETTERDFEIAAATILSINKAYKNIFYLYRFHL